MDGTNSTNARRAGRLFAAFLAGCVLALSAPTSDSARAQEQPAAPRSLPPGTLDFEPPPGSEWLTDERGREYFLETLPLYEGYYKWENAERTEIRLSFGARYEVASVDDEKKTVTVRIFRPAKPEPRQRPQMSAEERERLLATYRVDPPRTDRLRFAPLAENLPRRGQWRNGFDLADFNGDGKVDIVHGPPRKGDGRLVVFLGDGKGGFARWSAVVFPADAALDYGDVAAADYNRDGKSDVAVGSHLRGIQVFVGDGRGTFRRWSEGIEFSPDGKLAQREVFTSRALRSFDWNGDRRPDLLAFGEGPRLAISPGAKPGAASGSRGLRVFLNQGDGTWKKIVDPGSKNYADNFAIADLNGDSRPDVFTASLIQGYLAVLNLRQDDGTWLPTILDPLRKLATIPAVLAEDFDGDRKVELVLSFVNHDLGVWHSGLDLYSRRADGGWERKLIYGTDSKVGITALAAGDLDGDRKRDIVGFDNAGASVVLLGDGSGGFALQESAAVGSGDRGCRGYRVRLVDLDGDRRDEVLANFAGESDLGTRSMLGVPPDCVTGGSLRLWDVESGDAPAETP